MMTSRRHCLRAIVSGGVSLALPSLARAGLPGMTEGPFYPSATWRARELDWDADLTRVTRSKSGDAPRAAGEWLDLGGNVVDARGRAIDGAENNWPSYESTSQYEVAKFYNVHEHTRIPEIIIA